MKDEPGFSGDRNCRAYGAIFSLFFSIRNFNAARYVFIALTFSGILSTGWYGLWLISNYLVSGSTAFLDQLFALLSALGSIWGIMAYREYTRSIESVVEARAAARRLDPMIGDYEYRSYNPIKREYDEGFVPSGPVDFWDKETQVPEWMDKGKYWHILMNLQGGSKELRLHVVKDAHLPYDSGARVVSDTTRVKFDSEQGRARLEYVVRIPQWLVMNTERSRFAAKDIPAEELTSLVSDVNKKIVSASDEVAGWERQRIRRPWKSLSLALYLNKSLPLRIVYGQVLNKLPGARIRTVDETNKMLAIVKEDQLTSALLRLANDKGIPPDRIVMLELLIRFLKNSYTKLGLGEGASEYHNFHHSLEVSYMALHMLPREIDKFTFGPKDVEIVLVASLLHDYDPAQATGRAEKTIQKGPSVVRTVEEITRTRIVDAYFSMTADQFAEYFRLYESASSPPADFATTHPEYVKVEWSPVDSAMVEALIWHTDFPFPKQKLAQEMFARLLMQLTSRGVNADKTRLMAETLWLADLAVTYMGSEPVMAWDRVTNLYEELSLPKLEAVLRTDAFFGDFADNTLFKQLMNTRNFPNIFRQRWNLVYRFFHEGNPSTQINRTIVTARKKFSKVNLELGMRHGDMLLKMALDHWSEYFIGIGMDQHEVLKAKGAFAELNPQNASVFWGNAERLIQSITDRSVDNFILVLPEHSAPSSKSGEPVPFGALMEFVSKKLVRGGTMQILTDIESDGPAFEAIVQQADRHNLGPAGGNGRSYFPQSWRHPELRSDRESRVIVLSHKQ